VLRTACLLGDPAPLSLKSIFDFFVALKRNGRHFAAVMAVMVSVGRVVAENTAVIARVDPVVDIGQVAPYDQVLLVKPDLPSQNAAAFRAGQVKPFVNGFSWPPRHDL
jgi:hypothetical protein